MDNSYGLTGFFFTKAGNGRPIGHATAFTLSHVSDGIMTGYSYDYDGSSAPIIFDGGEVSSHGTAFIVKAPTDIIRDIKDSFNHIAVIKKQAPYRYAANVAGFHVCDGDGHLSGNCLTIPMKIFEECGLPHFADSFPAIFTSAKPQDAITNITRLIGQDFHSMSLHQSERTKLSKHISDTGFNALIACYLSGDITLPELAHCEIYEDMSLHQHGTVFEATPPIRSLSCAGQMHPVPLRR